jgi:hypothetical protein
VRNPRRAGSPERGDARPPAPEDPETQAGRDVDPAQRVMGDRERITTLAGDGRRESSGGVNPKQASARVPARGLGNEFDVGIKTL